MPTLISLFSGAGGLDVGLEQAGFDTVAATDFDEDCVSTLLVNQQKQVPVDGRPECSHLDGAKVLNAHVADLTGSDLAPGELERGSDAWR